MATQSGSPAEILDELFLLVLEEIDVLGGVAVTAQEVRQVSRGEVRNIA